MKIITKEIFKDKIYEKFGDRFSYILQDNFKCHSRIEFKCSDHGVFSITGHNILSSRHGCPACGKIARAESNRKNATATEISFAEHVIRFRNVHGDLYEYPEQDIKNSHSKIRIICHKHGEFCQHIHSHYKGVGCQSCYHESTKGFRNSLIPREERIHPTILSNKSRIIDIDIIKDLFKNKHGNKFDYDWSEYIGKAGSIKITCHKHGKFVQLINEHIKSKYGCPSCAKSSTTIAEIDWLSKFDITHYQHKIQMGEHFIKVDGYNTITNTVYEYLGNYWHGHPIYSANCKNIINQNNKKLFTELFDETFNRFQLLKSMEYNIIYVWEYDLKHSITLGRAFLNKLEF